MDSLQAVCPKCPRYRQCKVPCPAIEILADGNKPLREALVSVNMDRYAGRDYKDVLRERQNVSRFKRLKDDLSELLSNARYKDQRSRFIVVAVLAGYEKKDIATALNITTRQLNRLYTTLNVPTLVR